MLEEELPERFGGVPGAVPGHLGLSVTHKVEVATVADFAASRLGVDPSGGLSALDWLTVTGQSVLEVTAGPVFADRTRTLAAVRTLLAWYPPDVERYVAGRGMAAALPAAADDRPDRRGGRRARLTAAERGTRRRLALAGVRVVPPVGAVCQVARHRLPLAPRRRPARAAARRRRRGARMAGTRERAGLRLRRCSSTSSANAGCRRPRPR